MKKTTMMLAIISAIVATGLAVSPTLATPVFAQGAATSGAATSSGSAASSASANQFFGDGSSTSAAGEDASCSGQDSNTRCDAIR